MNDSIYFRLATPSDYDAIWNIIHPVISKGDTYMFDPASSKEKMLGIWCEQGAHTYVAIVDNEIKGTFVLRDNKPDLGSHVANCSYMVAPGAHGQGIGKQLGLHSLTEAKRLGYHAMQFNFVVKSNEIAVKLWLSLGFQIIGEVPEAFNHQQNGYSSVYVMYKKL